MKLNETKLRTTVKTITIRILFTLSHLLNGFIVTGALVLGAQIAGVATLVNMCLFWLHDRAWNLWDWNRREKLVDFTEGHPRTISKSITWRVLITINNFMIPYLMTGSWKSAAAFLGIATIMNTIIYYGHERIWNIITWGKHVKNA